jgi:hypothetical protein
MQPQHVNHATSYCTYISSLKGMGRLPIASPFSKQPCFPRFYSIEIAHAQGELAKRIADLSMRRRIPLIFAACSRYSEGDRVLMFSVCLQKSGKKV